jgi:8-oxo-dGTP pyrophosphatase MutT (NUDIX family)
MEIVYAKEPLPTRMTRSLFLAGPTPRSDDVKGWRENALDVLQKMNFDGHVFVPEPRDGEWAKDYVDQIEWEESALNQSDCILFWVPREIPSMLALTTNDEWGYWKDSGKVVFGAPDSAVHVRYQQYYSDKLKIPQFTTMLETIRAALAKLGSGKERHGGEVKVPLYIWTLPSFQSWYLTQLGAGNVLQDAKVLWSARVGKQRETVFCWILKVDVFITAEDRVKSNEFVLGRPDVSSVVLWHRASTLAATEVVLVKEFRSPARTQDAFIRELPGGSSKHDQDPVLTAVEELREEANFSIDQKHLKSHGFRQLFGTLSSVGAHVFSAEINDEELAYFKSLAGQANGIVADSERTFVEVYPMGEILQNPLTDWATLGSIFSVLSEAMR